jgi:OOP family OmpA-OmpF porin
MNCMKTAFAIVLPAACMAISAPAIAQQSDVGWYVGGSYGMTNIDVDTGGPGFSVDGDDSGFKIYGGFQFTKHWGAEVGYVDFGKAGIRGSVIGIPFTGDLGITAFTLAGTGTLPLGTNFALLGKVGLAQWEADASVSGAGSASDSGSDMFYGIGARYSFNKNLSVQAEYEVLDMDVDSVTMMSIGLRYKF